MLTIQEVAKKYHIKPNKLRFYEEKGLLTPYRDPVSGYRKYGPDDLVKLQLILIYRSLEVPIKDIQKLMADHKEEAIISQLYTQWQVTVEKIKAYKGLQERIEALIDGNLRITGDGALKDDLLNWKEEPKLWTDRWTFDDWAPTYDEFIRNHESSLDIYGAYETLLDKVYELSCPYLKERCYVLDIGVGTGNLAGRYLKNDCGLTGVDPSKKMLYEAKIKHPSLKLRVGDFLKLPFEDDSFDLIVSTYAFHHLNDDEKVLALKEMIRVLKGQGCIIMGDLMFESSKSKETIMATLSEEEKTIVEDEYYTNIETFGHLIKEAGYGYAYDKVDRLLYTLKIEK